MMEGPVEDAGSASIADLAKRVDALVARVTELEEENRRLGATSSTGSSVAPPDGAGAAETSRRGALKWAAASAAGAVAGATVLGTKPAAAAAGSFTGNPAVTATATGTGTAIRATVEQGTALEVNVTGPGPGPTGGGNGSGLTIRSSGRAHIYLGGYGVTPVPSTAYPSTTRGGAIGEILFDGRAVWLCTASGTPGTWRRMASDASAGAFHPWAARAYDSRPGTSPNTGTKSPLSAAVARTIDLSSVLWEGDRVVGALLAVHVINPRSANGNLTLWPNGGTAPNINHLLWTRAGDRVSVTTYCGVTSRKLQVRASAATDIVIDVLGYYM